MEKKIPEKKVVMEESDIFYVYEKRINKCIKEGCDGVVKYGLIIKVAIDENESINCFACNKCHMKYTPYPNYNRLENKQLSAIYNAVEVAEWSDRTKRKVENRNAGKNKRSFTGQDNTRTFEHRRTSGQKKRFGQNAERYERYPKREYDSDKERYTRREDSQDRGRYAKREAYQNKERYAKKEHAQNREEFARSEGYQGRGNFQKRDGYQNRYRNSYRDDRGKAFIVRNGNIRG